MATMIIFVNMIIVNTAINMIYKYKDRRALCVCERIVLVSEKILPFQSQALVV